MAERILLIGYRGAGKSTVGEKLAKALHYDFLDTDEEIIRKGRGIDEIVAEEGWDVFRQAEREVLHSLGERDRIVVATGGGAVLHKDTWHGLADQGCVIWLRADVEELRKRIGSDEASDSQRPSLTGTDCEDEVLQVLQERLPLYRSLADYSLDTAGMDIDQTVAKCMEYIERNRRKSNGRK